MCQVKVTVCQRDRQIRIQLMRTTEHLTVTENFTVTEARKLRDKISAAIMQIEIAKEHDNGITSPE